MGLCRCEAGVQTGRGYAAPLEGSLSGRADGWARMERLGGWG